MPLELPGPGDLKVHEPVVKNGNVVVMPDSLEFEEAAVVEPLACCYNAYESLDIKPGNSLLIFGAGPMGILHLILNKHLGIGKTIVVDLDKTRLQISKEMGADYTVISDKSLKEKVMDITGGEGVDYIITAASAPIIQEQALELIAINGGINYFAGLPASKEEIKFNSNIVHYKQLRITGTTGASLRQFRRTVKLAENKELNLKRIVTKKIKLKDLEDIFEQQKVFNDNIKIAVDQRL